MSRGPTTAVKKAAAHVAKHPSITAAEVAKKFGLDVSTVYRAVWWKHRKGVPPAKSVKPSQSAE